MMYTKQMWDGFYELHRRTRDPLHNDDGIACAAPNLIL